MPRYAPAQYVLGWLHVKLNEPEQARKCFEHALQLDPEHTGARYELAALLFELGEEGAGEAELSQVLQHQPEHVRANVAYGGLLAHRGRLPAARARYERAISANANNGPAHYKLSSALQRLGSSELAEKERILGASLNAQAEKASKVVLVLTEPDGRMLAGEPGSVKGLEQ